MENEQLKNIAVGALTVALLISLGYNLGPGDTHFCRDLDISMECNRISGTGMTCYPTENTTVGKKYCSSGWEEITTLSPNLNAEFKVFGNNDEWFCKGTLTEGQPLKCYNPSMTQWLYTRCVMGDQNE